MQIYVKLSTKLKAKKENGALYIFSWSKFFLDKSLNLQNDSSVSRSISKRVTFVNMYVCILCSVQCLVPC